MFSVLLWSPRCNPRPLLPARRVPQSRSTRRCPARRNFFAPIISKLRSPTMKKRIVFLSARAAHGPPASLRSYPSWSHRDSRRRSGRTAQKIPFCFKIFSVNTVGFEVETLNFTPALFSASNSSFMPGYKRFSYTPFSFVAHAVAVYRLKRLLFGKAVEFHKGFMQRRADELFSVSPSAGSDSRSCRAQTACFS